MTTQQLRPEPYGAARAGARHALGFTTRRSAA